MGTPSSVAAGDLRGLRRGLHYVRPSYTSISAL